MTTSNSAETAHDNGDERVAVRVPPSALAEIDARVVARRQAGEPGANRSAVIRDLVAIALYCIKPNPDMTAIEAFAATARAGNALRLTINGRPVEIRPVEEG